MNNLLIITGAGASHDIIPLDRVPTQNRTYQPPLTKDLFLFDVTLADGSPYSANCLQEHSIASQVGHNFYNLFGKDFDIADAISLEEYLKEIKNSNSPLVRKQFWAIPIYFFNLFSEISRHYTPTNTPGLPSNYKTLLDSVSESDYEKIIWLNLNYDLLADFAIRNSISNKFENLDDYMNLKIQGKKTILLKYTKPHGSIDWFKTIIGSGINLNEIQLGKAPDNFESLISQEIIKVKVNSEGAIIGRPSNGYPAITAPIGAYKFVYQEHINNMIADLTGVNSMLCIGFSALDNDVLDLIKIHVPKIRKLQIVNGTREAGDQAHKRMVEYCANVNVPYQDTIFEGGFTQFSNREIHKWLSR